MPRARKTKQPADDPQLKQEVSDAVGSAKRSAKTGNVATAKEPAATAPDDSLHLRDVRPE